MSRFTQGLLKTAMQQVYTKEKEAIREYIKLMAKPEVLLNFIRETQKDHIKEETIFDGKSNDESEQNICTGCTQTTVFKIA